MTPQTIQLSTYLNLIRKGTAPFTYPVEVVGEQSQEIVLLDSTCYLPHVPTKFLAAPKGSLHVEIRGRAEATLPIFAQDILIKDCPHLTHLNHPSGYKEMQHLIVRSSPKFAFQGITRLSSYSGDLTPTRPPGITTIAATVLLDEGTEIWNAQLHAERYTLVPTGNTQLIDESIHQLSPNHWWEYQILDACLRIPSSEVLQHFEPQRILHALRKHEARVPEEKRGRIVRLIQTIIRQR